ncbi:MAG TPA: GNAT family N-acetyltransferase [Candidatus Angelobacter sp.]|nr:GNAT family N-acetyltransferase [Candidatus Angelobacter sp.]
MKIKQAELKDVDVLAELFDLYRLFYGQESDIEGAKAFLNERLSESQSTIFLATVEQKGVGFAQLYPSYSSVSMKRTWILNDLYVKKEQRGSGIGEALLQQVLDYAKETGTKGVLLETNEDNVVAQSLYEKMGFERETHRFYFYTVK